MTNQGCSLPEHFPRFTTSVWSFLCLRSLMFKLEAITMDLPTFNAFRGFFASVNSLRLKKICDLAKYVTSLFSHPPQVLFFTLSKVCILAEDFL